MLTVNAVSPTTRDKSDDIDETALTWGLQSTRVPNCALTGRNIRVAVLDTGLDLNHPDFEGRTLASQSFVAEAAVQDGNGHGTHCIGTSLGPIRPANSPRYGIAYEAHIYAGKVLGDEGKGRDESVLAGINWAITNQCRIVSMSLGVPRKAGDAYSQVYETVAQRALAAGTLLIAAAGNESERPDVINPVGHPADCPSVMAVGAVDSRLQIAPFSTRSINPDGGSVDIAAPGVAVYSTMPMPERYARKSGTSMATPHVAGIAALFAEAKPNATGRELWALLVDNVRRLELDAADVGAGLVQAPA
jgi:subtilisin family serine protease